MNSEWGFENRRGVSVRAVTQLDDSDSSANEEVDDNMSELVARVCKQVISELRNTPQVQKIRESNKTGHIKTAQNNPCHYCSKLGNCAYECPAKLKKTETSVGLRDDDSAKEALKPLGGK